MAPTHPPDRRWFCASPSGNKGPFTAAQMSDMLAQGALDGNSSIWRDGFTNWTRVRDSGDFDRPQAPAAAPTAPALIPDSQSQDDHQDKLFVALVKRSWERFNRSKQATEVDEVLVGAVIAATLDNGYSLIDLMSDGTSHGLRFEQLSNGDRIIFRLRHTTGSLLSSSVLGHEAQVTIGYGERVKDFGRVWTAIRQEMKGGYIQQADPGIITVDGDISSQYIYVEVGLIWDLNDYLDAKDPYTVKFPKLTQDIGASIHALRKYLRGRLGV